MALPNSYDAGTVVRVSAAFTNVAGAPTDPGTVTFAASKPDGTTVTTITPAKDSTGNYHADVDTTGGPAGLWLYRFSGTTPVQVTSDGQFYVKVLGF